MLYASDHNSESQKDLMNASEPVMVPRSGIEAGPENMGNLSAGEWMQRHGSDRGERNRQDVKV